LDRESARRKAATYIGEHKYRINANIHALRGLEPKIPVSEQAKLFRALECATTVIGWFFLFEPTLGRQKVKEVFLLTYVLDCEMWLFQYFSQFINNVYGVIISFYPYIKFPHNTVTHIPIATQRLNKRLLAETDSE
jgi:hypothetical protein